jgi:hypothetical protein
VVIFTGEGHVETIVHGFWKSEIAATNWASLHCDVRYYSWDVHEVIEGIDFG